jgi:hypothetical protein
MLSSLNAIPHSRMDYRLVGLNNSAAVVIVLERRVPALNGDATYQCFSTIYQRSKLATSQDNYFLCQSGIPNPVN